MPHPSISDMQKAQPASIAIFDVWPSSVSCAAFRSAEILALKMKNALNVFLSLVAASWIAFCRC
jgi:hypothetical protein